MMLMVFILCGLAFELAQTDIGLPQFPPPVVNKIPSLDISEDNVKKAFSYAKDQLQAQTESENKYIDAGYAIPPTSLSMDIRFVGVPNPKTIQMDKNQKLFEDAAKWLSKKYKLTRDETLLGLPNIALPDNLPAVQECKSLLQVSPCDDKYKYRTADGSCNNLLNPTWGRSNTCANRIMKVDYSDGVSLPKLGQNGIELPNARFVSRTVSDNVNVPSETVTQMFLGFAHFTGHDLSNVVSSLAGDSEAFLYCCPDDKYAGKLPSVCYPIDVPKDDPDFSQMNRTCISQVRDAAGSERCKLGDPRRTINQHTSFLDGSTVYGDTDADSMGLRSRKGGTLRNQYYESEELPPPSEQPDIDQCTKAMKSNHPCIQTGDYRAIQLPALTSMHIIFFREHNRIARIIARDNPELSDEEVFQEARRIVIAELQMIAFNEMIPILLGADLMDYFKLNVLKRGFSTYDPKVDPRIFTENAATSARFGHTLTQRYYKQFSKDGKEGTPLDLNDVTFRMNYIYDGEMDSFTRGLYGQSTQAFDRHFVDLMINGRMNAPGKDDGIDHVAFNIHRGRELGLPSYPEVLKFCYNITLKSFSDLKLTMPKENVLRLQKAYSQLNDIDLYIGGFSENPITNSVLGPTFACLFGQQYHNIKFGDRFYFEHGKQAGSFTEGQLKELRKLTFASIFCRNSGVGKITPKVFRLIDAKNAPTDCANIPSLNFKNWLKK